MTDRTDFTESVTTQSVLPHERTDYWAAALQSHQGRIFGYAFPRKHFHGRTAVRRTRNYQIVGWRCDAVAYYRTPGQVRVDSDEDYRLLLPTAGRMTLWQDGRHAPLPPGIGCLVTVDQPFAYAQGDDTEGLVMTIRRPEIDHRLNRAAPEQILDFTTGLGRVVAEMATTLFTEHDSLGRRQFDAVSSRLVDLLCMHILGDHPTESGHLEDVEAAIRHHVRTHAHDPELTGAAVARALGWSLRQIQLTLQRAGTTPRELIREERLQLAYVRLQDPAYRNRSISALAADLGFGSASAFSTAFRGRFGASPRDMR
ncbi:AraC family transcriptional regulator [Nocardia jiangxiensis]|uniref:AraC family transcriptional regulator n=1 Tax=Nocardia jiangxiensis TaxID=282685 RepID=A0ABW6S250_9NOCA|nr:AraC family transcriptional regulator [Nocardia jiangxiensis]